jgi:hypothetical protein
LTVHPLSIRARMTIHPFHLKRQQPMTASLSWQGRLDGASTEAEIIAATREFVAQFSPQEIQRLPKEFRPGKFFDANDVTAYAFAMVRHECDDQSAAAPLVHKLASFFSNASIRLSQIMARSSASDDDSRQSA